MNLHDEIEFLRGSPIEVFPTSPQDVPCIETSDTSRLCCHPVVSVHMITYNHERFIRRAIEGVMAQRTDFEFELVIGEDCSTDRTREICIEYQNKFPDKVRVLWWTENVSKLGGNYRRVMSRCRGEFVAFCEGDDYWTNPDKLQHQVDVMRANPSVGLCFTGADILYEDTGKGLKWDGVRLEWDAEKRIRTGLIPGMNFFVRHILGSNPLVGPYSENDAATFLVTATVMMRRTFYQEALQRYEVFNWRMRLMDTTTWLGLSSLSDVFYLPEKTAVYFRNRGSSLGTQGMKVGIDGCWVRIFYCLTCLRVPLAKMPSRFRQDAALMVLRFQLRLLSAAECRQYFKRLWRATSVRAFFFAPRVWPELFCGWFGLTSDWWIKWLQRVNHRLLFVHTCPAEFANYYEECHVR